MAANTFYRYDTWVSSATGPAIAGAQVYVCTQPANVDAAPPSPLAAIYSDSGGLVPITQPLITDGFGHANFYALPGLYTVVIALNGIIQSVYPDQSLGGVGTAGGGGGGQSGSLLLQSNGVTNPNQLILNLESTDSSVTITADSGGNVNLQSKSITTPFMLGPGIFDFAASTGSGVVTWVDLAHRVAVCRFLLIPTLSGVTHLDGSFGSNLGGGSTFAVGIYSDAGNLLWTSGPLSIGNVSNQAMSYSVPALNLPGGVYYLAWTAEDSGNLTAWGWNTLPLMSYHSGTSEGNVINQSTVFFGYAANAATSGPVLPPTLGALTAYSAVNSFAVPAILFH